MKNINKIFKYLKKQKKIEKKLKKVNSNIFIGKSVFVSKEYKRWLKSHLNELFDTDDNGSNLNKKDKIEFNSRKLLISKKIKGTIIEAKKDSSDFIVLKIKFTFKELKNYKSELLLSINDVKIKAQ